jgi:hypothetical protein
MSAPRLRCPIELEPLLFAFIAEEATSELRHTVANKVSAARNGAYYVQRKLEADGALLKTDGRLGHFLSLIDQELGGLTDLLRSRLPDAGSVNPARADASEAARSALCAAQLPAPMGGEGLTVRANPDELRLALHCLLFRVLERSGRAEITVTAGDGRVRLAVPGGGAGDEDLMLKIGRRVARRWGGELMVAEGEASLMLTSV